MRGLWRRWHCVRLRPFSFSIRIPTSFRSVRRRLGDHVSLRRGCDAYVQDLESHERGKDNWPGRSTDSRHRALGLVEGHPYFEADQVTIDVFELWKSFPSKVYGFLYIYPRVGKCTRSSDK
jgi:hypothetical protein